MTLVWRPGFQFDADASTYIEAVEAADTQALETGVRYAINDFVIGCKQDGIWTAIKASCILAGARTLAGALVPLVGAAPTNFNFVAGDYNRETGLKGDGSTKYLNTNRAGNADPQNSRHLAAYIFTAASSGGSEFPVYIGNSGGGGTNIYRNQNNGTLVISVVAANNSTYAGTATNFVAGSRSASDLTTFRASGANTISNTLSVAPLGDNYGVLGAPGANLSVTRSNGRLSFYSIGESLDLTALDTRVSALITAIGAAIP